jgi:hypothetical protein
MSTIDDIENAIQRLSPSDLASFRAWFAEFDARQWDRQLDEDVEAGRLDALADEAIKYDRAGRSTDP